jgi:methylenetetrahydrofolate dehydrogenase (NADP+) / methenyltetrahydrofolate cyclohydrolase
MTATLISGRQIAAKVLEEVRAGVEARAAAGKPRPHLSVVLVGDDPASHTYVRLKRQDSESVGMTATDHRLAATTTTDEVLTLVRALNDDERVSGVLVQQPMPPQVDAAACAGAVDPAKDVDGLHPVSAGRLLLGQPGLRGCTPAGVIRMLDESGVELAGRRATVLGRSNIVGKPMAVMLLERNATVTVCHSRTRDLAEECRRADILVVAIGRPHFVTADMVQPGAVVIDVGITPAGGRLRGDVDPAVAEVAGMLSPVPGGVGPMTRAMLMRNTLLAEEARRP